MTKNDQIPKTTQHDAASNIETQQMHEVTVESVSVDSKTNEYEKMNYQEERLA